MGKSQDVFGLSFKLFIERDKKKQQNIWMKIVLEHKFEAFANPEIYLISDYLAITKKI